jgi:hypothetical protein
MFIGFILETGKAPEYLNETIIYHIYSLIIPVDVPENDFKAIPKIFLIEPFLVS